MAKRVSLDIVRNVVRAGRPKSAPTAPTYLVKRRDIFFFQIRWPKKLLVPCLGIPPLRIRLGIRSRRVAQQRALWLAGLARQVFERATMSEDGERIDIGAGLGFPPGNSPREFIQNMAAYLADANAALDRPVAPPGPSQLRGMAAVQELTGC